MVVVKDTPYSIFLMALTVGLCSWFLEKRTSALWLIGFGLAGTGCLRYDGAVPLFLTVVALSIHMVYHREELPRLAIPVAGGMMFWLFATFVLPLWMNAERGPTGTQYAKMAHVICDIVAEGGKVNDKDMALIEREIMPREIIMRQYHFLTDRHPVLSAGVGQRYIWTSFGVEEKYSFAHSLAGKGELVRDLFFSVSSDNPLLAAKILLLNSQMIWNLKESSPKYGYLLSRPQLSLFYGSALFLLICVMMKKRSYLIPFVPLYGVVLAIGVAATTYEIRYLLPLQLLFPLLFLYSITCAKRADEQKRKKEEGKCLSA